MTTFLSIAVIALAAASGAFGLLWVHQRDEAQQLRAKLEAATSHLAQGPSHVGDTVVLHTLKPDDQSIRGIVQSDHADRYLLREAEYLHASGPQPVGSYVEVPKPVSSVQILEPGTEEV